MAALEYEALLANIATDGVLEPIAVTAKEIVLDGRHRLQAARELDHSTIPIRLVAPADETAYILRAALHRRNLTPSQVATLAIELDLYKASLAAGRKRRRANLRNQLDVATLPHRAGRSRELLAQRAGVSERTLQDASTVHAHNPELFEQIKLGRIPARAKIGQKFTTAASAQEAKRPRFRGLLYSGGRI
jgi:ParB-like chromosome segregation protein Spo0J